MFEREFHQNVADAMHEIVKEIEKTLPEQVVEDLHEMASIQAGITKRLHINRAIEFKKIQRYNELCYKHFGKMQDGEEFTKEEPEPEEVPPTHPVRQKRPGGPPTVCDMKAEDIVNNYIVDHLDKSDPVPNFEVYIVWKCKTLQNWKWLLASTLPDSMYYELTYNGDKGEYYLDAYRKVENKVIKEGALL